jgi:hypothetical protein
MMGLSLQHWEKLRPSDSALAQGVLTQLGGVLVLGPNGQPFYQWRDDGICHVADFEDILEKLEKLEKKR